MQVRTCLAAGVRRGMLKMMKETTAGGIPHWVTSEVTGHLRTNDSSYREAWTPYIREIARLSREHQVTNGGPIIAVQVDNEYSQDPSVGFPGKADMMHDIEVELRQNGIVVPLTYNDASPRGNYAKGLGSADIYGLDSYPQVRQVTRHVRPLSTKHTILPGIRLLKSVFVEPCGGELL